MSVEDKGLIFLSVPLIEKMPERFIQRCLALGTDQVLAGEITNAELLISPVGVDYSNLNNLLSRGQWQDADLETKEVMLRVIGRDDYLPGGAVDEFSCEDLAIIDLLWIHHSGNRFGFSVQVRILQEVKEDWDSFGDRVGWRVNQVWRQKGDRVYDLQAPKGHLPSSAIRSVGKGANARTRILKRFAACELSEW